MLIRQEEGAAPSRQTDAAPNTPQVKTNGNVIYFPLPEAESQLPGFLHFFNPFEFLGSKAFDVVQKSRLSGAQKGVMRALLRCAWRDGKCFPGQEYIAAEAGITSRTVRRALKALEQRSLLRVMPPQKYRTCTFHFILSGFWLRDYGRTECPVNQDKMSRQPGQNVRSARTECPPNNKLIPSPSPETTTPTTPKAVGSRFSSGGKSEMPDEIRAAIDLIAPHKESMGWAVTMQNLFFDGGLNIPALFSQAEHIRAMVAQQKAAKEEVRKRAEKKVEEEARKQQRRDEKKQEIIGVLAKFGVQFTVRDMLSSGWLWEKGESSEHPEFERKKEHTWYGMTFEEARSVLIELAPDCSDAIPITLFSYQQSRKGES